MHLSKISSTFGPFSKQSVLGMFGMRTIVIMSVMTTLLAHGDDGNQGKFRERRIILCQLSRVWWDAL